MWSWLAAAGCGENDAARYLAALESGDCDRVVEVGLRESCWTKHLACEAIDTERSRHECYFRRAERAKDASLCALAGSFEEDCRMHLWSDSFRSWSPSPPVVGRDEELVAERAALAGFTPDDPRPWSAWYRHALSVQSPMDRTRCSALLAPMVREACMATGLTLYGDRLNAARDRGLYPCDGGELPEFLRTTPDPEIDALRASRTDLCP